MYKFEITWIMMMFFFSINMLIHNYKHTLINLIILEFLIINFLYLMYINMHLLKMNIFFTAFFLTISVCESIMGLSIIMLMIRLTGNDFLKFMNLMKW